MPSDFISKSLACLILAGFVGVELIKRVSPLLHDAANVVDERAHVDTVVVAAIIICGRHETRLSDNPGSDCGGRAVLQQHGRRILHYRP